MCLLVGIGRQGGDMKLVNGTPVRVISPDARPEYRGKCGVIKGYTLPTVVIVEFHDRQIERDIVHHVQFVETEVEVVHE